MRDSAMDINDVAEEISAAIDVTLLSCNGRKVECLEDIGYIRIYDDAVGVNFIYSEGEAYRGIWAARRASAWEDKYEIFCQNAVPSCPIEVLSSFPHELECEDKLADCGWAGRDVTLTAGDWVWDKLASQAGRLKLEIDHVNGFIVLEYDENDEAIASISRTNERGEGWPFYMAPGVDVKITPRTLHDRTVASFTEDARSWEKA